MNISLISQFLNLRKEESVASTIVYLLRSSSYNKMRAMVAFVNYGGISGLTDEFLKSNIKDLQIVVGIDNKITSVEALHELLRIGFEGKIYHTSGSEIFHPKFYLFENANDFALIIGSNNMTTGGLALNDECAVLITGNKEESIYKQADETYNDVWATEAAIAKSLTDEIIEELYVQECIPSESDSILNTTEPSDYDEMFGTNSKKNYPTGFAPIFLSNSNTEEVTLLPHNQIIYEEILKFLKAEKKGYIVQPTGTGKSYLMAKYITDHKNENIMVIAPNNIILSEMKKILGANIKKVLFVTYQYLAKDIERTKRDARKIEHILIDEFHHLGAEGWGNAVATLIDNAKDPVVLGFSATPKRDFDDINVPELFFNGNCIHELTLFEAWRQKILPVPTLVQSYVELDGLLNNLENEVSEKQNLSKSTRKTLHDKLEEIKSKYISDTSLKKVITDYIPRTTKKIIVFVPQIETMTETERKLTPCIEALGVQAHNFYVHSQQGKKKNDQQLELFHEDFGGINLIYSVDMLIEGLHVDGVDALILLRNTNSVRIALQQLGRCLSSNKIKKPIVLDIVNNYRAKEIFGRTEDGTICNEQKEGEYNDIYIQGNFMEINEAITNLLAKYNNWEENFKMLLDFKNLNGRPPKNSDNCRRLYVWWIGQRKQYRDKTMQEERIKLFKLNGFILDEWEENFNLLRKFIKDNGRIPIITDRPIGLWLAHQRQNYRDHILSEDRANLLHSIGINLLVKREWGEWFEQLKRFVKDKNREPRTSAGSSSLEGQIYGWLNRQRIEFKEGLLEDYKIHAFAKLGIPLESTILERELEDRFEIAYKQIKEFVDKHHRLPRITEDKKLYNRILGERQKIKRGTMPLDRVERLRALGVYSETEEEWMNNYKRILAFIAEKGRKPNMREDKWWDSQVFAYKKLANGRSGLTEKQIKLLEEIGVLDKKESKGKE